MSWLLPSFWIWVVRLTGLFFLLLPSLNWGAGNFSYFIPELDPILIFFWTIASPAILNQYVLVFFGLYQDIVTNAPFGFNGLIYLGFYFAMLNLRRFFINTSFHAFWIGFIIFSLCFVITKYIMVMIFQGNFFVPQYMLVKWLVLICIYPYAHLAFSKIR